MSNLTVRTRVEAQRDIAVAALRKISEINLGPDRASGEWRCVEAEQIALVALAKIAEIKTTGSL